MKFIRALLAALLTGALLGALNAHSAQAQSWPSRPITLLVGASPGGSMDTVSRTFAEFVSSRVGQPIVVENKPGGGGVVTAVTIAKAAPDGYTFAIQAIGPVILRPIMDPAVGYDFAKDFSPIILLGDTPNVILGGTKISTQSLKQTVDWARQNPGQLTMGHPGPGTMGHLAALLLASNAGITGPYIAYKSGGDMLPDLLGGRIDIGVAAYTPQLKSARVLAVMTEDPLEFLPGVPSMREAGFPSVYASTWYALFGAPNLAPAIVTKLNTEVNEFLRSDDARKRFAFLGFRAIGGSPEQLAKRMADDTVLWSKVIKDANVRLDGKQ
jgi:tripartite-type tricarboxylate transporter receptor subunit TctC